MLRYRSAREIATDSNDSTLVLSQALDTDSDVSAPTIPVPPGALTSARRIGTLAGLASRPDIDAAQATEIANSLSVWDWPVKHALIRNPRTRHLDAVHDCLDAFCAAVMIEIDLDGYGEVLLRILGQNDPVQGSRPLDQATIDRIASALGPDRIDAIFTSWLHRGPAYTITDLTRHPCLTPTMVDRILDYGSNPQSRFAYEALDGLAGRSDLTEQSALALLKAVRTYSAGRPPEEEGNIRYSEVFILSTLSRNQDCPDAAFIKMATHRLKMVRDNALTHPACPDVARWAAADRHFPWAILKAKGHHPIPSVTAHTVLDDLEAGVARRRPIADDVAVKITDKVVTLSNDPTVWDRAVERYLARTPEAPAEVVKGIVTLLCSHDAMVNDPGIPGDTRFDVALRYISQHVNGHVRAGAVPYLGSVEDVASAVGDPAVEVRLAALAHPMLSKALLYLLTRDADPTVRTQAILHPHVEDDWVVALADDPSPLVRATVAEHPAATGEVLAAYGSSDPDVGVREAAHRRLLALLGANLVEDPTVGQG